MTGSRSYADIFDKHVELCSAFRISHHYLVYDSGARRQLWPSDLWLQDDVLFSDILLNVFKHAASLECDTWALANRLAPPEWWLRRIGGRAAP